MIGWLGEASNTGQDEEKRKERKRRRRKEEKKKKRKRQEEEEEKGIFICGAWCDIEYTRQACCHSQR